MDFEYVLIEANDKSNLRLRTLLSIKILGHILMSNPYEVQGNWSLIQSKDKDRLVEYLKHHTIVDEIAKEIRVESFQPSKELIVQLY